MADIPIATQITNDPSILIGRTNVPKKSLDLKPTSEEEEFIFDSFKRAESQVLEKERQNALKVARKQRFVYGKKVTGYSVNISNGKVITTYTFEGGSTLSRTNFNISSNNSIKKYNDELTNLTINDLTQRGYLNDETNNTQENNLIPDFIYNPNIAGKKALDNALSDEGQEYLLERVLANKIIDRGEFLEDKDLTLQQRMEKLNEISELKKQTNFDEKITTGFIEGSIARTGLFQDQAEIFGKIETETKGLTPLEKISALSEGREEFNLKKQETLEELDRFGKAGFISSEIIGEAIGSLAIDVGLEKFLTAKTIYAKKPVAKVEVRADTLSRTDDFEFGKVKIDSKTKIGRQEFFTKGKGEFLQQGNDITSRVTAKTDVKGLTGKIKELTPDEAFITTSKTEDVLYTSTKNNFRYTLENIGGKTIKEQDLFAGKEFANIKGTFGSQTDLLRGITKTKGFGAVDDLNFQLVGAKKGFPSIIKDTGIKPITTGGGKTITIGKETTQLGIKALKEEKLTGGLVQTALKGVLKQQGDEIAVAIAKAVDTQSKIISVATATSKSSKEYKTSDSIISAVATKDASSNISISKQINDLIQKNDRASDLINSEISVSSQSYISAVVSDMAIQEKTKTENVITEPISFVLPKPFKPKYFGILPFPKFEFDLFKSKKKGKRGKQKKKYAPSLIAKYYNIKGKKSLIAEKTGLGIRKIIT